MGKKLVGLRKQLNISFFCYFRLFFPLIISAGILRHLAEKKEVTRVETF